MRSQFPNAAWSTADPTEQVLISKTSYTRNLLPWQSKLVHFENNITSLQARNRPAYFLALRHSA